MNWYFNFIPYVFYPTSFISSRSRSFTFSRFLSRIIFPAQRIITSTSGVGKIKKNEDGKNGKERWGKMVWGCGFSKIDWKPQMKTSKIHKWRHSKSTNEDIKKPQMKKLKIRKWKKLKNHKWRNWKITNQDVENPELKNWKSTNEEIGNQQIKKLKNHKWR